LRTYIENWDVKLTKALPCQLAHESPNSLSCPLEFAVKTKKMYIELRT